jgi:hypothetical protein
MLLDVEHKSMIFIRLDFVFALFRPHAAPTFWGSLALKFGPTKYTRRGPLTLELPTGCSGTVRTAHGSSTESLPLPRIGGGTPIAFTLDSVSLPRSSQ